MELIINIPDRIHYGIQKGITVNGSEASQILIDVVKNGITLPKGHGDLIDREELKKIIKENDPLSMTGFSVCISDVYKATTIIPADIESEG